jgi:hypothetical protein
MTSIRTILSASLIIILLVSCNYVTYTPRSKKNIQREKPSVVLLNAIIDYRVEQYDWPVSREEFINKGKKFRDAFEGFPYSYTRFKMIDSNTMVFYFSGHIKDERNYQETQKADLNSYSGSVRFYKDKDRFAWKLKMD